MDEIGILKENAGKYSKKEKLGQYFKDEKSQKNAPIKVKVEINKSRKQSNLHGITGALEEVQKALKDFLQNK